MSYNELHIKQDLHLESEVKYKEITSNVYMQIKSRYVNYKLSIKN